MTPPGLDSKAALITGGPGDIGKCAIARRLEAAAEVIVTRVLAQERKVLRLDRLLLTTAISACWRTSALPTILDQRHLPAIESLMRHYCSRMATTRYPGEYNACRGRAASIPFPALDAPTADMVGLVQETNLEDRFYSRVPEQSFTLGAGRAMVDISTTYSYRPLVASARVSGIAHAPRAGGAGLNHLDPPVFGSSQRFPGRSPPNLHCPRIRVENTPCDGRSARLDNVAAEHDAGAGTSGVETWSNRWRLPNKQPAFVTSQSVSGQTIVIDGGMPQEQCRANYEYPTSERPAAAVLPPPRAVTQLPSLVELMQVSPTDDADVFAAKTETYGPVGIYGGHFLGQAMAAGLATVDEQQARVLPIEL